MESVQPEPKLWMIMANINVKYVSMRSLSPTTGLCGPIIVLNIQLNSFMMPRFLSHISLLMMAGQGI